MCGVRLVHTFIPLFFFFLMPRPPPRSTQQGTLSPYTTLFRSRTARSATCRASSTSPCGRSWSARRSEEHTFELQSRLVISYAVFCLKKKKNDYKIIISYYKIFKFMNKKKTNK